MLIRSKRAFAFIAAASLTVALGLASVILLAPPATGQVGVFYTFTFGTLGTLPDTYAVTSGSLPPGLTLNPNTGVLSGTPLTAGPFTFSVQVTDSSSQQSVVLAGEASRYTKGMANANIYGPYPFTITISPASTAQGAPISPAALALLMLGLAAAGIFRMRTVRQA